MFRRKRSASQHHHPLSTSSTQSAQSAATHAFLKSQPSSSSLSSAAAAAALRSLTPTPTAVENVQTKRMLQRQASLSSQTGIAPGLRPSSRNGLRRTNSSGSMTARTFREQSPHRPASSSGPKNVAPPLPTIPREYTARKDQNRRSVSLGPNVWSSLPGKQSSGGAMSRDDDVIGPGRPPSVNTSGSKSPEHQRSGSRNSINFSYPMNSRTNSPTLPPGFPDRRETTNGASIPSQPTPSEPPQNKNHVPPPSRGTARHRARGPGPASPGRSPQPGGTALAAAQAAIVHRSDEPSSPSSSPHVVRQRDQPVPGQSPSRARPTMDQKLRSSPAVVKRPSTVVEDRRAEEEYPQPVAQREPSEPELTGKLSPEERLTASTPPIIERAPDSLHSPLASTPESTRSTEPGQEIQTSHLRQSSSPGRTARFSTRLSVMKYPGDHLHQPLGRSVSPAKSALKHPRKNSVSPDGRIQGALRPGPLLSELSDATSVASDEGSRSSRKKAVKVSFDDEAEIVGVAASPPTSPEDILPESPPGKGKSKTNWFGFSNKRRLSPLRSPEVDEFDGVLKPRPALPSFGSIRTGRDGAKLEIIHQEFSDNESTESSEANEEVSTWSFSNDHAIGGIISRASRKDANARAQLDGTPPRMQPAKGEEQPESQKENTPLDVPDLQAGETCKPPVSSPPDAQSEVRQVLTPNPNLAIPDITVQPATPGDEKGRPSLEGYDVPGGFPRNSVDFESQAIAQKKGKRRSNGNIPSDITTTSAADHADHGETDDESSESIYSDAEEELNGEGFSSINAILDGETTPTQADFPEHGAVSESVHQAEYDTTQSGIPETCQIAHVRSPAPNIDSPPAPASPDSSHEPLPFSSPYPPFPIRPSVKPSVSQGTIPRSSTMPANIAKESTSVKVYSIAQVDSSAHRQKRTLRSDAANPNISSLRRNASEGWGQTRPVSWAPGGRKEKAALNAGEQHVHGRGAPIPQRQLSNGSDSSSSFKRSSRPPKSDMQHSMRRTLRGSPGPAPQPSPNRPTFPSADARPLSSGSGAGSMRRTLRGSAPRQEKPSLFSTSKSQRGRFGKASGAPFTSRFADSDSESDGEFQKRRLQRRKQTAGDEDMRPVRGIPRRQGTHDGDSTELEDSSDNERRATSTPRASALRSNRSAPPARDPALAAVAKSRGMTERELEQLLSQPRSGRKPSLLHRFSIRKPKPLSEPGTPKLHVDDASRNGRILEHGEVVYHETQDAAGSHKLSKKTSQKSSGGETWPLRSDHAEPGFRTGESSSTSQRPRTSDGVVPHGSAAHTLGPVSEQAENLPDREKFALNGPRASDVVIEFPGRKKRFSRFRKAFGLGK